MRATSVRPSARLLAAPAPLNADIGGTHTAAFARAEDEALAWLAAADPRLARRSGAIPSEELVERIGTEAVLDEDVTAQFQGRSLDLFAFRARGRTIDHAARALASFREPLLEVGPPASVLARPELERELLGRLIEEEKTRAEDEARLGEFSGELVRGIVSTWTAPQAPHDWLERDAWVSKHLLEIRESLRDGGPRAGPSDLDVQLYPLERLLVPLQFPRGSAALAQVRMALDADIRPVPTVNSVDRIARAVRVYLGMTIDGATLRPRLERLEERLRSLAETVLGSAEARGRIEAEARQLLFVEGPCPTVTGTLLRVMAPPPERAAICGALRALTNDSSRAAAIVALHDDVLLSFAAVVSAPPPRTGLLSRPENDIVDAIQRAARERPVVALGVALAAELLYGDGGDERRLKTWAALGEAPLDIAAREMNTPSLVVPR